MNTFVVFRRNAWATAADLEQAARRSSRIATQEMPDQVRWIRSYVVNEPGNRLGTVCIYQARDEASLSEHARRAQLPCDAALPVKSTVVIADDPVTEN